MYDAVEVTISERLDLFATRLYGSPSGHVEAILDANPGLAARGFELTAGEVLLVPRAAPVAESREVVRLWT